MKEDRVAATKWKRKEEPKGYTKWTERSELCKEDRVTSSLKIKEEEYHASRRVETAQQPWKEPSSQAT